MSYEDIVRQALAAREHATTLRRESRRVWTLARMLQDAYARRTLLRRCAWCGRVDVGGEWLDLEDVGTGRQQIVSSLLERTTHGMCPDCVAATQDSTADRR